jgi:hypothetical protein
MDLFPASTKVVMMADPLGCASSSRTYRSRRLIRTAFATLAVSLLLPGLAGSETVRLTPTMKPISADGVAGLNVARNAIPDADMVDPGLRLLPDIPHHWFAAPGTSFRVRAQADAQGDSRVVLTVWNWELQPVFIRRWTPPHNATLTFDVDGRGTYLVTFDRLVDTKTVCRLVRSFAVCPTNAGKQDVWRNAGQFFVGTCAYPERMHWRGEYGARFPDDMSIGQAREKEAALAGRLGFQVVRLAAVGDWTVDLFEKHGMRAMLKVGQSAQPGKVLLPHYENVTEARWRYPMPESVCRPHYAEVAKKLAERAVFIEIGNEADNDDFWHGTADEFIAQATWAAEELNRHAPEVPSCVAGWTFIKPDLTRQYVRAFRNLFPWSSIHAHGDFRTCVEQLDKFERLLAACNASTKPRVQTEMGFCHWRLDMDAVSAGAASRKIIYHWAKGYKGVITYRLRDQGGPRLGGDLQGMWGVLDHQFCPRFKYGTLAALIDKFADYRFSSRLEAGSDLFVYSFTNGSDHLVVAFAADLAWRPVDLGVLRTTATRATLVDPMGNETPAGNAELVPLRSGGIYPVVVRLRGGVATGVELR